VLIAAATHVLIAAATHVLIAAATHVLIAAATHVLIAAATSEWCGVMAMPLPRAFTRAFPSGKHVAST
jgi:hypothetical protein